MLKSIAAPVGMSVVVLFVLGLAYELGFQLRVGSDFLALTPYHYVLSGIVHAAPPFVFLIVFSLIYKFLTPRIKQDDWKEVNWNLARSSFDVQIGMARTGFLMSLIYLILVAVDLQLPFGAPIGTMYWFMLFVVSKSFMGSVLLSPNHAKATVVSAFVLSLSLCCAAGGIWTAAFTIETAPNVRDDLVLREEQVGGKWVVSPKEIPFLSDLKAQFKG